MVDYKRSLPLTNELTYFIDNLDNDALALFDIYLTPLRINLCEIFFIVYELQYSYVFMF